MSKMKNKFKNYINVCSTCQLFKFFRQFFYDKFHSIEIFQKSLIELFMNFIIDLFMTSNKYNSLITIIDRFNKYVRLISKKKIWFTKKWIEIYHDFIFRFWNLSIRIIIDRNFKFINEFWTILFQKCDVVLNLITIYHFFAND